MPSGSAPTHVLRLAGDAHAGEQAVRELLQRDRRPGGAAHRAAARHQLDQLVAVARVGKACTVPHAAVARYRVPAADRLPPCAAAAPRIRRASCDRDPARRNASSRSAGPISSPTGIPVRSGRAPSLARRSPKPRPAGRWWRATSSAVMSGMRPAISSKVLPVAEFAEEGDQIDAAFEDALGQEIAAEQRVAGARVDERLRRSEFHQATRLLKEKTAGQGRR